MSKVKTLTRKALHADVAIAGGGPIGLTLAIGLAKEGHRVTVVDALSPREATAAPFDGRCSAIAHASKQMLDALGIWPAVSELASPIQDIRVCDGHAPIFLHFDHHEIGDDPHGFMVENRHLRAALLEIAATQPNLTLLAPETVTRFTDLAGRIEVKLGAGGKLTAPLVIGADGRNSALRKHMGVAVTRWRYPQTAIVTTVSHSKPHKNVAYERFFADGPFAILPLKGRKCAIVWSISEERAGALLGLDNDEFAAKLDQRIGGFLGKIRADGRRWNYPLGLQIAHRYVAPRMALVGDAAHVIHPIAGQGLNLGFRDVAALIEVLGDARRLGLDLGSLTVLRRYERWRRADNLMLGAMTDGLVRLFSNDLPGLRLARRAGLGAVNRIPPLRRFFMRHARGTVGKLPRLLTGKAT